MSKAKNLATFGDNVDSSGNITDLNVDSNTLVVDSVNNRVGIGTAPNKKLHIYRNDSNTDAQIVVEQAGAGDATVNFLKTGVYAWMTGIDNTDNKYKISGTGDDLNTNNYFAIDTTGNVGIGTTPLNAYRFEVMNDGDTNAPLQIWYADMTNGIRNATFKGPSDGAGASYGSTPFVWDTGNAWEWRTDSIEAFGVVSNRDVVLYKDAGGSATEGARWDHSTGRLGIGTATPSAPLDVAGNIFISADTTETVKLTIGNGRSGDGYSYVDLVGDATYTEYGLRMIRNNTGANATSDINHRGTGALRITAVDAGSVQLKTNNTNRFQVDSTGRIQMVTSTLLTDGEGSNFNVSINGYVGISSSLVAGVGSGAVALSINDGKGNANLTFNHHSGTPDVTGNSFRIETNVDSTTGGFMVFEGLSTTTAGVDVNLNMMATMYADTGNMTINGSLTQNSDLRIKKDLQIIPDALDKLKTLNGYTYTRTDRPMEFQQTGCVAQEVQAVLPEAVVVGEDEQQTLSIAYGSMVGLLVQAIKELEAKVAALESGA